MKFSKLYRDSDVRPFRFAIVIAVIIVVILLSKSGSAIGQETVGHVNWTTSYGEALRIAEDQNAPLMLFFAGSDWCPWCQKLSAEVFDSPEFSAWSDSKLIPVMVDFPRTKTLPAKLSAQNNTLMSRYRPHLTGFPTALFIKPDGTVIGKLGYEKGGVRVWIHEAQKIVGKLDKVAMSWPMNLR